MASRADVEHSPAPTRPAAAAFIGSFTDPLTPLDPPLPELAFLGRSNVGKSSLLNALVGLKGLAKVSATPGKTQAMNVFRVGDAGPGDEGRGTPRPYYLIDLPGYGYAKTSKTERARFATLLHDVLTRRETITGVVWLLDIRHDPSAEDRAMGELLAERGLPVLAVLTKGDKLGTSARRAQAGAIAAQLGLAPEQVETTSSKSGLGLAELRATVAAALAGAAEEDR